MTIEIPLALRVRVPFHGPCPMAANEIRDTPGRLLLGWAVLLTSLVILSWRIHVRPAEYEWTEYPTALGDAKYYTALGKARARESPSPPCRCVCVSPPTPAGSWPRRRTLRATCSHLPQVR